MGNAKGRGKGWREKYVGVIEVGDRCPKLQTAMLQYAREIKEYSIQHPNTNKHRQRRKGSDQIQKRDAKFNPKT